MNRNATPAEKIVHGVFAGVRRTARAIGKSPSTVSRWLMAPPDGTGGEIPRWNHDAIVEAARREGWRAADIRAMLR
jgi:DNA-binding LacI/PurR family transcriptional regulator